MQKPQKKTLEYWEYRECINYLEQKYGFIERDTKNNRDFWHYLVDTNDLHNGQWVTFGEDEKEIANEWQWKIINLLLHEFGETNADGNRSAEFWVEW